MKRVTVLMGITLMAAMLPFAAAVGAPKIRFISPSPYQGQTATLTVSDKQDKDTMIHIAAWVKEIPTNAIVEFEIVPATGNGITLTATRVGSTDTWESFYDIPANTTDGAYTFRAILYSGQMQVAVQEQTVTINNSSVPPPPQAETVEMTYPVDGGEAGFFTPKGGKPNVIVNATASADSNQVRVFYTNSDAGDDPVWQLCGFGTVGEDNTATVRCTLNGNDAALDVTAIAVVSNLSPPPADPQAAADQTGDAHRVLPYTQVPTEVSVTPPSSKVNLDACTLLTAQIEDQKARPIALANVDVHAVGPSDQLRFGTSGNQTSGSKNPDKGVHSTENGINCSDKTASNSQGDHNRPGQDDEKHIESTTGTNNGGRFTFALYSAEKGGTAVTVWADVDDDDFLVSNEASGGAVIGWGEDPPPPPKQLFIDPISVQATVGSCQKVTITAKQGGLAMQNANVDIHASGPGSDISFCPVEGESASRPPDQGGHTGNSDPDGSIHVEGETDTSGRFVVGVTSGTEGATELTGWIENADDDVLGTDETSARGEVGWGGRDERKISLKADDRNVNQGARVKLSGRITGSDACESEQTVKLQARTSGRRFQRVATTTTSGTGTYSFKRRVSRTTEFRAVAPRTQACGGARSGVIKVRTH